MAVQGFISLIKLISLLRKVKGISSRLRQTSEDSQIKAIGTVHVGARPQRRLEYFMHLESDEQQMVIESIEVDLNELEYPCSQKEIIREMREHNYLCYEGSFWRIYTPMETYLFYLMFNPEL